MKNDNQMTNNEHMGLLPLDNKGLEAAKKVISECYSLSPDKIGNPRLFDEISAGKVVRAYLAALPTPPAKEE